MFKGSNIRCDEHKRASFENSPLVLLRFSEVCDSLAPTRMLIVNDTILNFTKTEIKEKIVYSFFIESFNRKKVMLVHRKVMLVHKKGYACTQKGYVCTKKVLLVHKKFMLVHKKFMLVHKKGYACTQKVYACT